MFNSYGMKWVWGIYSVIIYYLGIYFALPFPFPWPFLASNLACIRAAAAALASSLLFFSSSLAVAASSLCLFSSLIWGFNKQQTKSNISQIAKSQGKIEWPGLIFLENNTWKW